MTGLLKKAGLGVALAATVVTAAAPAEAQRWGRGGWGGGYHHGWGGRGWGGYHHGGRTSAALLGGIVGLGVGAAIASSARPRYYNGYYDGGYYAPPPRAYYYDSYYDRGPRCWSEWRYDPYYGGRTRVRICN